MHYHMGRFYNLRKEKNAHVNKYTLCMKCSQVYCTTPESVNSRISVDSISWKWHSMLTCTAENCNPVNKL